MAEAAQVNNDIPKKKANELDGKTWLRYSVSVWNDIRKTNLKFCYLKIAALCFPLKFLAKH